MGGPPNLLCCWALTTSWYPMRYGGLHRLTPSTQQARNRTLLLARTSISEDSTRESDDAYRQFADMLGETTPSIPQGDDAKKGAYADFADRLGLDDEITQRDETKKSVTKLSPKKLEIDPEDYNIFDEMLERTGGRGRKPVKGSKPYTRKVPQDQKVNRNERSDELDVVQPSAKGGSFSSEGEADSVEPSGFLLTEEEKAQAYAVMMEEFGPSAHDDVEAWTPDDDVDNLESRAPPLLEPPKRPGAASRAVSRTEPNTIAPLDDAEPSQVTPITRASLHPKPSRPISQLAEQMQDVSQTLASVQEGEVADMHAAKPPAQEQLHIEGELRESEVTKMRDGVETQNAEKLKNDTKPELNPPPFRSIRADILSERAQMHAGKGPLPTAQPPTISANVQRSHGFQGSALPNPKRPKVPSSPQAMRDRPVESRARLDRRKQFFPMQRSRIEETPEVLKDPKLVYQCE